MQQKYILHWGEMGTRWGINRTVAQIHALLYLSPRALPAEEIAETLSVARSNVSTSIRELEAWGIVRAVHVLGDRREHYESMKDVWEMFRLVIEQRKRREIDPTREMLRRSLEEMDPKEAGAEFTRERLAAMAGFFEAVTELHDQMKSLPTGTVRKLLRMGAKVWEEEVAEVLEIAEDRGMAPGSRLTADRDASTAWETVLRTISTPLSMTGRICLHQEGDLGDGAGRGRKRFG